MLHVQRGRVRFVSHLQHRTTVLDAVAVDEAAEELPSVQPTCDHDRDLRPGQGRLPEHGLLSADLLGRNCRAVGQLERNGLPVLGHDHVELNEIRAFAWRRIHDRERVERRLGRDPREGPVRQLPPDLLGLGVTDEYLCGNLVSGAAANRVVRRVLEHARPGLVEELVRPGLAVQRLQWFGIALEPSLRPAARGLEVDAGRDDARQKVGAGRRAHLAAPARKAIRRHVAEIVRESPDNRARGWDPLREVVHERHVVRSDHPEDVVGAEPGPEALLEDLERWRPGHVEEVGRIAVAPRQVLRNDGRTVRRFPDEAVEVHGRRHAAPDDGGLDSRRAQDLRHLRDVAEHVRQVPDSHRAPELRGAREARFEVPHDRLAVDEELVHERLPRPDREAVRAHELANPFAGLRADLEVVVDGCQLTVEREAQLRLRLEPLEHLVDDVHERDTEGLEGPVPLPVPVRVRDEEDAQVFTEPASRPCTKYRCNEKNTTSGTAISRNAAALRSPYCWP